MEQKSLSFSAKNSSHTNINHFTAFVIYMY